MALPGSLLGFFIASYTGVLLGATNRPVWAANNWIGPLFLVSAASTGAAALVLLLARSRLSGARPFHLGPMGVEAMLLALFLQSLGAQALVFLSGAFAVLFWGGLVLAGLAVPFVRSVLARARALEATAAVLVLVGGFVLRYLVLSGGQT